MKKSYLDMLSVVIAAVAVALSQFPPISSWFGQSNIGITDEEVLHFIQTPLRMGIQKNIHLENTGEKPENIGTIKLSIYNKDSKSPFLKLASWGYFNDDTIEAFNSFNIDSESTWSSEIVYLPEFSIMNLGAYSATLENLNSQSQSSRELALSDIKKSFDYTYLNIESSIYTFKEEVFSVSGVKIAEALYIGQAYASLYRPMQENAEDYMKNIPDLNLLEIRKIPSPVILIRDDEYASKLE